MPDYGWAYINLDALSTLNGPTGSLAFRNGSQELSGTAAFIYATASHKIGIGVNVPGALTPATLPSYILDVSASAGDTTAFRTTGDIQVSGNAYVSGTLAVESLHAHTVISSSNLIVRDPLIGMGFGDGANETGSVGDRGLILGLAGDLNQAILWDQTSGSFVIGKVGAQGPDKTAFDIPDGNLSTVRLGYLTASNTVSASEYHGDGSKLTGLAASAVTSYTNASNNRIITSVDSSTINGEASLTFDGSILKVAGNVSGSGTLQMAGNAFLGGNLNVTGTIKAPSLGADEDNTVVIVNSSGLLKTDEIDPRVFGSALVDASGTPADNQLAIFTDANTVEGSSKLTFNGSILTLDAPLSASGGAQVVGDSVFGGKLNVSSSTVFASSVSGSSTLEIVGNAFLGGNLNVTGTIKAPNLGTDTDSTVVIVNSSGLLKTDEADSRIFGTSLVDGTGGAGQITLWNDSNTVQGSTSLVYDGSTVVNDNNYSGSGTFENVGSAVFGNTLEVSGTVSVTSKIEHALDTDTHLKFDTDKIEFIAGNETLLTLTEDTQDIVTVGDGGDVDFQVKTSAHNHTIFAQGSDALVGIRSSAPTAVLHLSESGASQIGMPKPMFRIDHPGDAAGKEFTEALFCVTASIPDDYFEARVGINTKTPDGAFHVKTQEGQNTFLVVDDKVVIGNNNASSKFQVRKSIGNAGDRDVMLIESILNNDDTVHNLFYATGSTDGSGVFGSFNTGSALKVSGSSFMTSMHVQYSGTNQDTNVGPRDYIFGVDTSGGSPKIFLESAAVAGKGRKIVVKDTGNNAGSNNIKITGSTAGDLIEYAAETLVNANKAAKTLVSDGVSKWFVIASG
jgi:hypothetical protein